MPKSQHEKHYCEICQYEFRKANLQRHLRTKKHEKSIQQSWFTQYHEQIKREKLLS